MTRRSKLLISAVAACAIAPTTAQAGIQQLGSNLQSDANLSFADPNDWVAWNTSVAAPANGFVSQVYGEIVGARLKGEIVPSPNHSVPPNVAMHIQVLEPFPDGRLKPRNNEDGDNKKGTSQDLPLPFEPGADPNRINSYTKQQISGDGRLCVEPGDYVALSTNGGFGNHTPEYGSFPDDWYNVGATFRMFGRVDGSAIDYQANGPDTNQNGMYVTGTNKAGYELLLQVDVATAQDAGYTCLSPDEQKNGVKPTDNSGYVIPTGAAAIVKPKKNPKIKSGKVKIGVVCTGPANCAGTLTLTNRNVKYGAATFAIPVGQTVPVTIKLNKTAKKQIKKGRGKVTVKGTVVTDAGKSTLRFVIGNTVKKKPKKKSKK